jgi:ABC-type phosphate transport system, ATPase component
MSIEELKVSIKNLNVFYGEKQALFGINLNIYANEVTSLIGPSGCGKSTLINV